MTSVKYKMEWRDCAIWYVYMSFQPKRGRSNLVSAFVDGAKIDG